MRVFSQAGRTAPQLNHHGIAGALVQWWTDRQAKKDSVQHLRVIETLPLNNKQKLMLVQCAGQQFLVGVGLDQISTILPVEPTEGSIGREARCD
ncbi:flagellar biosynthetic protein FliO [Edaphobacter sp. 12200R-103]|jgi:flagellar biogenesis protein FliO|uniref:flagellar biosynthetic protein FliO n=1 Tax=Edaphobacter sp. 12200R-103 TaxID=2703788 RepID=UPI00138B26A3|nr:flagellar biosynthetic protein FliO [Edaphobacter sp. 12200R-103]QHS51148.1 flagellar biosynthetic protein FliO [Edaphobacter sp. 12200R-103]